MPVGTAALALPLPIYNGYSTETEKEYQRARHARFAKEAETRKAAAKAEKSLARRLEERPLVFVPPFPFGCIKAPSKRQTMCF